MNTDVIKNFPSYAANSEFIVVRESGGDYWFYGAYKRNANQAYEIAAKIDGIVIHNVRI